MERAFTESEAQCPTRGEPWPLAHGPHGAPGRCSPTYIPFTPKRSTPDTPPRETLMLRACPVLDQNVPFCRECLSGQVILCYKDCPVNCRVYSSNSGFYPLDASNTPSSDHQKCLQTLPLHISAFQDVIRLD